MKNVVVDGFFSHFLSGKVAIEWKNSFLTLTYKQSGRLKRKRAAHTSVVLFEMLVEKLYDALIGFLLVSLIV